MTEKKDRPVLVRLSATEARMLRELSGATGLSRAAIIRTSLREKYREDLKKKRV